MASLVRHRPSLAVGNVVGSTISNILGAFSLGLLFNRDSSQIEFDQSSKIYTLVLLIVTISVAGFTGFSHHDMWRVAGAVAIALFVIYLVSIVWMIHKGRIAAPELSDTDSSGDEIEYYTRREPNGSMDSTGSDSISDTENEISVQQADTDLETERSDVTMPLLPTSEESRTHQANFQHGIPYHISLLLVGFLCMVLSSYVLSHAASTLIDELGISDVLFGVVILSIATTLPEKFVAVISGYKGHAGILVANTVGSNIFLLTLCMGILWVSTGGSLDRGSVNSVEVGAMLGSTVALTSTVWFGEKWSRWIGGLMLLAYVAFLILECTLRRK